MKISALLQRRLHWLNLPGAILMMLLQRAPVLNTVTMADEMVVSSPISSVLKTLAATVAALGAINSMAGATAFMGSKGTSTGITLPAGTAVTVTYTLGTPDTEPDPTGSWTISVAAGSSWPPGLMFSGLTAGGVADVKFLQLTGTPTTAGTYTLKLQATSKSGGYTSMVYTYTITVTATNTAPSITTQPSNQSVTAGASTSFTAAANGTPTPTLQWQREASGSGTFSNLSEGGSYTGTTTGTLSVSGTTTVMNGDQFRCVATNSVSSATSNAATLTVNPAPVAPSITTQPTDQVATAGGSASFTFGASGSPTPTLQWQRQPAGSGTYSNLTEGGGYTGTTTGTLTVSGTLIAMSGDHFRGVATNSVTSATSNAAMLTVNPASAAPSFTTQPAGQTIVSGNPVTFTAAATGTPTPTLQWQKNGTPILGATGNTYMIASVAPGDAATYTVVATNSVTSTTSNDAVLTVNVLPLFTSQPASQTRSVGSTITFTAAASGTPVPTLQWQKGGAAIAGATNSTLVLTGIAMGDAGIYTVVATNAAGSTQSNGATLTVRPAAADFNGDGKSDLVWQDTISGDRLIWLMNGTAPITALDITTIPTDWSIAGIGDFNNDGQPDIVWQNTVTGERLVWLMSGTTPVDAASLGIVSTDWIIVGTGDLNGDGNADLLWTNKVTGERTVWLMNGTTPGATISLGIVPFQWSLAGTGDFDGDGQIDLLWDNTLTGQIQVWLMNGTTPVMTVPIATVSPQLQIAGVGDYNGDGNPDILWTNQITGERSVWLMNGTVHTSTATLTTLPLNWVLIHPIARRVWADFNSDGKSDLIWQNSVSGDTLLYLMDGTAPFTAASLGSADPNLQIAATGDFNADGKADLVWQNKATGDRFIWLMNDTTMASSVDLGIVSTDWSIIGTGDFNADGSSDLIWKNTVTGEYIVWLMNGTTPFNSISLGVIDPNLQLVGTGDFNADASTDLLWQNNATGERLVWLMNGTTFGSSVSIATVSTEWTLAGTGDFNGDGQTDLLWTNTVTGDRLIWLMYGTVPFNAVPLAPIPPEWALKN